jgi:hypothetical protein
MATTYFATLPTAKDRMRHRLGDVDMAAPLETDETYTAMLAHYQGLGYDAGVAEALAIATMAEALATRFAQKPGAVALPNGMNVQWSQRVATWLALAATLRRELGVAQVSGVAVAPAVVTVHVVQRAAADAVAEYERPAWWTPCL